MQAAQSAGYMLPRIMMMRRTLRDRSLASTAAVSMAAFSSTLVAVVTEMLSLEIKLMAVSLAWAGLYQLQRILVGKRRCSGHYWYVQYGAMAAYYLPAPLAFYAANAVYSTSHINESTRWLVAGVVLMFRISVPVQKELLFVTNMRAYSLQDHPRGRCNSLMWLVFLGCVWARIHGCNCWGGLRLLSHMVEHFVTAFVILFANAPESTLDCQTKAVADYMKRESSKSSTSSPFFDHDDDANSNSSLQLLDCCRYPFVQGKNGKWVTVKDLVQRDDLPNEDKDIWLSYSLCRLLARRYYGFHCAEEGDDMVRRLVLADLGRTNNGYKRAFTIVEVQLAFLHDYFFTASLPIIESGLEYIEAAQSLTFDFTGIISTFLSVIPIQNELVGMIHTLVEAVLSMFMSWCVLFGMPMSLLVQNLLAIYWRPIRTVFHKLNHLPDGPLPIICLARLFRARPNPNAQDVFDPFETQTSDVYWRNKLGQYSILQDYDRRPSRKKEFVAWFQGTMLSQPSYWFIKHHPVEEEDVKVPDSMRELVANTLWGIDGPPSNGTRSLKINMDSSKYKYDLSWTCRQQTHTDTVLIWHIATCYCDMTPISDDLLVKWHHGAARALSRYCAYLVAFLPEFLPEHSLTTKQVFQDVIQDAQRALGMTPHMEEEDRHTKIRKLKLPPRRKQTTFHLGVRLGRQLEKLNTRLRWKVMAEFWAETILYVAPSNNVEAHIEHLAKGGEFVTHLWAMLSNAGILKRATGDWNPLADTEGPATTQESIVASNSEAPAPSMFSPTSSHHSQSSKPTAEQKGKQPQIPEDQ